MNMKMNKRLSSAHSPLPKFQSDQEAADYFESHSVAGVWDQLIEAPQDKPAAALARKIRDRHVSVKAPISLRLAPEQIAAAKHIAAAKSVGYQTQLRMWIAEGIRRELPSGPRCSGSVYQEESPSLVSGVPVSGSLRRDAEAIAWRLDADPSRSPV
jgi:predicted DNA binding CopG/RHH family protein